MVKIVTSHWAFLSVDAVETIMVLLKLNLTLGSEYYEGLSFIKI